MASSTRTHRRGDGDDWRNDPLAEAYFRWLVERVREEGPHKGTYWDILRLMYNTEFVWLIPNDDNRLADGLDLRSEFLCARRGARVLDASRFGPCSVLEVMIGLSRRVEFLAGGTAEGWAWQMLCNLELHKYLDPLSRYKTRRAEELLHSLVWRTYDQDGSGGFFPLAWPKADQTKVELWYQMSAYVEEIHPEY
jgi:hypothetical protein